MKIYMALMMLMVFLLCTTAEADMNLSAYTVETDIALPVSDGRIMLKREEENAVILQMMDGAALVAEKRLESGDSGYTPFVFSDGRTGYLIRENDRISEADYAFCYWGAGAAASNPIELGEGLKSVEVCGRGFAALDSRDESMELRIYDEMGRLAVRRLLRQDRLGRMGAFAQDADEYLTVIEYLNLNKPEEINEHLAVERFGKDGEPLWHTEIWEQNAGNIGICTDGAGGAYVLFSPVENYKVMRVCRIGPDGNMLWKKTLEAEGLILGSVAGCYDRGELLLTARAVSKSRGVYDVIRLRITKHGDIAKAQAWDFSVRPDYTFKVKRAADGVLYAFSGRNYLDTLDMPAVLVPVNHLPEKEPPEMTLQ